MKVIEGKIPIKNWATDLEDKALEQAVNLSNLPFAFKHIALMPDAHMGYGMPIGGVLATTDQILIPFAVGSDIGCGVVANKTNLKWKEHVNTDSLIEIRKQIVSSIPIGFKWHTSPQDITPRNLFHPNAILTNDLEEKARLQLGTLGGGNHFIEIQKDTEDNIWIMIHSGSRNLGYQVAKHYNEIAIELNKKWHTKISKEWQLAFLPEGTKEHLRYWYEMRVCVDFAFENRKTMMDRVLEAFYITIGDDFITEPMINIAHNYARLENHFGKDVMVHRKGATSAREGEIGIIPGSQGTKSYIVIGLGNRESFESCSHGAGRIMGRKQAQRELNLEEEIKRLDEQGILHSIKNEKDLDEAPGAYKAIDVVMKNQKDLVEIVEELTPLAVVKG